MQKKYLFSPLNELKQLESSLKGQIFGQDHAVDALIDRLAVNYSGMGEDHKPMGSFLFMGPTGVGKTQLAKLLAQNLDMHFERFDMSEYMEKRSSSNLVGGAAGLVGYDEGGTLTNAVMENPSSVLLFDEIEKAHPKVLNLFLQILDHATLTDSKGDKACFKKCIIIFTSNLNSQTQTQRTMGFGGKEYEVVLNSDTEFLLPEFRARINSHIHFNPIDKKLKEKIVEKYLAALSQKTQKSSHVVLEFTQRIKDQIISLTNAKLGAREVHNMVDKTITPIISKKLLFEQIADAKIVVDLDDEKVVFEKIEKLPAQSRNVFQTAQEAQEYAKNNPGVVVRRLRNNTFTIKR